MNNNNEQLINKVIVDLVKREAALNCAILDLMQSRFTYNEMAQMNIEEFIKKYIETATESIKDEEMETLVALMRNRYEFGEYLKAPITDEMSPTVLKLEGIIRHLALYKVGLAVLIQSVSLRTLSPSEMETSIAGILGSCPKDYVDDYTQTLRKEYGLITDD